MTISYPLSLPSSPGLKRVNYYGVDAVTMSRSPFTFFTQVQVWSGDSWGAEVTLPTMERADGETWSAFIASLNGSAGSFYLGDPLGAAPRGTAQGSPVVDGASQTGKAVATKGWTESITGLLLPGDKFQIGSRLFMVLSSVDSDGSGEAVIDIWPRLRESPADEEPLVLYQPKGLFRLATAMRDLWSADETKTYEVSFDCVEAI